MEVIWKIVEGTNDLVIISNNGKVKALPRYAKTGNGERFIKEKELKISIYPNGYCFFRFNLSNKTKCFLLHRELAKAFIEKPNGKDFINHKNGIKSDNSLNNLEWCSGSENIQHAIKNKLIKTGKESPFYGLCGEKSKTSKKVICTTLGMEFPSIKIAGKELGVDKLRIGLICRGKLTHTKGLHFRYL